VYINTFSEQITERNVTSVSSLKSTQHARTFKLLFPNLVVVILQKVGFYTKAPSISPVLVGIQGIITHVTGVETGEEVSFWTFVARTTCTTDRTHISITANNNCEPKYFA
jgi:hypothetical protein